MGSERLLPCADWGSTAACRLLVLQDLYTLPPLRRGIRIEKTCHSCHHKMAFEAKKIVIDCISADNAGGGRAAVKAKAKAVRAMSLWIDLWWCSLMFSDPQSLLLVCGLRTSISVRRALASLSYLMLISAAFVLFFFFFFFFFFFLFFGGGLPTISRRTRRVALSPSPAPYTVTRANHKGRPAACEQRGVRPLQEVVSMAPLPVLWKGMALPDLPRALGL